MLKSLLITSSVLVAALVTVLTMGAVRWARGTRALRANLEAARVPMEPQVVDFGELEGLPAPVQRYFRRVLKDGQPMVKGVRVQHHGTFNMGETADRWQPFTSDQRVSTRRPGFDWDARIRMMPGLTVRVHDAYVAGEGRLFAALLGLFPVADLRGGSEVAEGELMRFLAESAWYPTALLPSQGVRWTTVDAHSARATLVDGLVSVTTLFSFDDTGLIETIHAEARARIVDKRAIPTPWHGRVWNYQERRGMQVPLEGEVAWLLAEGAKPYWRARIGAVAYEFAERRSRRQ